VSRRLHTRARVVRSRFLSERFGACGIQRLSLFPPVSGDVLASAKTLGSAEFKSQSRSRDCGGLEKTLAFDGFRVAQTNKPLWSFLDCAAINRYYRVIVLSSVSSDPRLGRKYRYAFATVDLITERYGLYGYYFSLNSRGPC